MFKNQRSSFNASLAADAVSLLRTWWHQDRIRSSPREGKLLRLAPGAIITVGGKTFEVVDRTVSESAETTTLCYQCRETHSLAELYVGVHTPQAAIWSYNNCLRELTDEEIEVWTENACSQ